MPPKSPKAAAPTFVAIKGTDILREVHEGMCCIVCDLPVEPGTGAQASPPLPALHGKCALKMSVQLREKGVI